jgi:enoyl-[acyl-carrier protein] reductase I
MVAIDLSGRKGLIMGVTNARSLGWGIAQQLHAAGAELAFSYQGDRLRDEIERLTEGMAGVRLYPLDVTDEAALKATFQDLGQAWGGLDFLVHAIAFAPRAAMEGRLLETSREDWRIALEVSAYSFLAAVREAEPLLNEGASIVTLTYYASEKVVPRYNVMALAKSALESTVRYLAYELGPRQIRVNAISAGPMRTVAARSIPGFSQMYERAARVAPLKRHVKL